MGVVVDFLNANGQCTLFGNRQKQIMMNKRRTKKLIKEVKFQRVTKVQVKIIIILKRLNKWEINTGSTRVHTHT